MGTSHVGAHSDASRISKSDCRTPGCGRTATREGLCGVCRDNFVKGNEIVWHGGELLPAISQLAWDGDGFAYWIGDETIH